MIEDKTIILNLASLLAPIAAIVLNAVKSDKREQELRAGLHSCKEIMLEEINNQIANHYNSLIKGLDKKLNKILISLQNSKEGIEIRNMELSPENFEFSKKALQSIHRAGFYIIDLKTAERRLAKFRWLSWVVLIVSIGAITGIIFKPWMVLWVIPLALSMGFLAIYFYDYIKTGELIKRIREEYGI